MANDSRIEAVLRSIKGPDVLHLGCSGAAFGGADDNWLHGRIRRHFPDTWGLDINQANVEKIRAQGFDNVIHADAQNFSVERSFDSVVAGEVIEHVERPADLLEAASRHLKPDGRIVLTTPYPFGAAYIAYALIKFPKTCSNPEHTMWFCPTTMRQLAERCGLRVAHWDLVASYRLDLDGSALYRTGARLFRSLGWLLPKRLRNNTMLFILEVAGGRPDDGRHSQR